MTRVALMMMVLITTADSTLLQGAHGAPARERSGARGPRERPNRGPGQSPGWNDIVGRLESGVAKNDAAVLRGAIADAVKLADATGLDRELALNGAAYGAWRLSTMPNVEPAESAALLKGAEKNLRDLLKMNPQSGE